MRFFLSLLTVALLVSGAIISTPGVYTGVFDGGGQGTVLKIINASNVIIKDAVVKNGGKVGLDSCIWIENSTNVVVENSVITNCLYSIQVISSRNVTIRNSIISSFDIGRGIIHQGGSQESIALHGLTQFLQGHGVYLWWSWDIAIINNTFVNTLDGVYCDHAYNSTILGNRFIFGNRYAVHLMYCKHFTVRNNAVSGYVAGSVIMYSVDVKLTDNVIGGLKNIAGVAVEIFESDDVFATGNVIKGNYIAIGLVRSPFTPGRRVVFANNTIVGNFIGVSLDDISRAEFTGNNLAENVFPVSMGYKASASFTGNFWGTSVRRVVITKSLFDWAFSNYPQSGVLLTSPGFLMLRELLLATTPGSTVLVDPTPLTKPPKLTPPGVRELPSGLLFLTTVLLVAIWSIRKFS